ncbi:hypothetical protein [Bacillus suaedaesalsae]|uniref:PepSY domain-containing protein n=1 Tax=Bacillus suaedaesalsae TaxID=2810349 RepID=A0ABS2DJC4_9BACI|nr:hypothetical protein [Bacillus suaedaesalsae]MBM6617651.1 hypothetical protein [Bacillus suaedaesalsae]
MFRIVTALMLICLFMVGCSTTNDAEPPAEQGTNQDEGMFEGEENDKQSNDDLLIDSREEVDGDNDDRISTTKAEELVREQLQIDEGSNTVVAYDSETASGHYLIRVNTVHDDTTNQHETDHDGLYTVNAITGEIQKSQK